MLYIDENQDIYDVPEEYHVFSINRKTYEGFTYVADKDSPAFDMLRCGHNFLTVFRTYYMELYHKELPTAKLYIIRDDDINAFALYEKSLSSYCIGVNMGTCETIYNNVFESFSKLVGTLIPEEQSDLYLQLIYIEAIRFFVAHEYSHILAGHERDDPDFIYFEFSDNIEDADDKILGQMKEFQVDQMAVQDMCYMAHWNNTTEMLLNAEKKKREFVLANQKTIPEPRLSAIAEQIKSKTINESKQKFRSKLFSELCFIMAGVNVVFYTFYLKLKKRMEAYAVEKKLSEEERNSFYYKSGLQMIRDFDHPLPALRTDAVTRIVDECIEHFVPSDEVEYWCWEVSRYSWEVEISRNDGELGKLYRHIAYTPTAQDFIQEMENLWQSKKYTFNSYVKPLVRLFYANRIVHMTDDGELIAEEG